MKRRPQASVTYGVDNIENSDRMCTGGDIQAIDIKSEVIGDGPPNQP
jgi:hypothetical protein